MRILIPGFPGSTILNQVARDVTEDEFGDDLDAYMSEMLITMYGNNGVGLAAPQVGDSRRLIVIDTGHVGDYSPASAYGGGYASGALKLVNPVILEASETEITSEEGCLSLPSMAVKVSRPDEVSVRYQTVTGDFVEEIFTGFVAVIIQHEIDHLDGITLLKHASSLKRSRFNKKLKKISKRLMERANAG